MTLTTLHRLILTALCDRGYPDTLASVQKALTPELTRARHELCERGLLAEVGWTPGDIAQRTLKVTPKGYAAIGRPVPRPSMQSVGRGLRQAAGGNGAGKRRAG